MRLAHALAPLAVALLACTGGAPDDTAAAESRDVRGAYAIAWSDVYTVRLEIGGVAQEAESDEDGIVTFEGPDGEPLELDLAAWCADPGVNCPTEAWAANVAIDQDDPASLLDVHTLRAWDADAPGAVVSGAVDHTTDELLFGLDAGSGSDGSCGVIAASLAGGRFVYAEPPPASAPAADADTAATDTAATDTAAADTADPFADAVPGPSGVVGITAGQVAVGWLGVCAWEGLAVGATLSISTTFEAVRSGGLPD